MAKTTGITATVTVDNAGGTATAISGDVMSFSTSQSREQIDVTGVDKDFRERLPGLGDWSLALQGTFNNVLSHSVFNSMGTALRTVTVVFSSGGTGTGEAMLTNYNVSLAQGGALTWTVDLNCANGTAFTWS